ncbi:MAG: metallophosphoesterase, partial [Myxococcales bacterium]
MRITLLLALLPLLASAPADAARIVRGPFLQQTSPRATLVVVHTDAPATVDVEARGEEGLVRARSSGVEHVLKLEGLAPGEEHGYDVRVDGTLTGSYRFRTPGEPGTPAGSRAVLGVIGDMGSGGPNERANVQQMVSRRVDAVLTVGDNSYPDGAPAEWDPKFFRP